MSPFRNALLAWLKKLLSDSHSAVVGFVLLALIGGGTSIYVFFENLWLSLKETMLSPSPLWATIALVLLAVVYTYLKTNKIHSSLPPSEIKKPTYKFFDVCGYRWKATIHRKDYFELDKYPYCPEHDVRFIFGRNGKFCPGTDTEECEKALPERIEFTTYESAKSIIESKIRNSE